jgi:hypothetical protein
MPDHALPIDEQMMSQCRRRMHILHKGPSFFTGMLFLVDNVTSCRCRGWLVVATTSSNLHSHDIISLGEGVSEFYKK